MFSILCLLCATAYSKIHSQLFIFLEEGEKGAVVSFNHYFFTLFICREIDKSDIKSGVCDVGFIGDERSEARCRKK
jgi:hypothetical protein